MSERIRRCAAWVLAAGVASQAAFGVVDVGCEAVRDAGVGVGERLGGDTDDRLRRDLGADFAVARALREVARPGEFALCRVDFAAPGAFDEPAGIVPRLTRLRLALFPDPVLTLGGPDPLAMAEAMVPTGETALLLVWPGERAPAEGPAWRRLHRDAAFEVWRRQP